MKIKSLFRRTVFLALVFLLVFALTFGVLAESFAATVTAKKMPVRSGPTTKDELLGYLTKGTTVTVHSYKDGIAYIEYQGKFGYARVSDMQKVAATATPKPSSQPSLSGLGTVTASSIKIYAAADTSSKVLGTFKKGRTVTVLATDGTWAKLQNGSAIGYAKMSGLKIDTSAAATATPTVTPTVSPTPAPTSAAQKFTEKYHWATDKVSETAEVRVTKMTVRESPAKNGTSLGTLKKGVKVTLHATDGEYAFIEYKEKFGFCLVSDLKITQSNSVLTSGAATVSDATLKVYASRDTSSKTLTTIKKGEQYAVLSVYGDWAKLQNGSAVGYAKLSGLKIEFGAAVSKPNATAAPTATATPTPTPTPAPTAAPTATATAKPTESAGKWWEKDNLGRAAKVSVSRMTVRSDPGEGSSVLGYLSKGTEFTVRAVKDGISYIEYRGNLGFASTSDYAFSDGARTATVAVSSMKVYASPNASSKVLGSYARGRSFTLVSVNGDWAELKNGTYTGYAKVSDLNLPAGSTPTAAPTTGLTISETMSVPAFVSISSAKVYKSADTGSSTVSTLKTGTEVTVLGMSGSWLLVERNGSKGYMDKNALTRVSDATLTKSMSVAAEASVSSLSVYKYASDKSTLLGKVSKGTALTVLAYDKNWALVERNGNLGYCAVGSLKFTSSPTLVESVSIEAITSASAPMYTYASADSKKLSTIAQGKKLTILAYNDAWCLVSYGNSKGYVARSKVTLLSTAVLTPNETYMATVKSKSTVYQYANKQSDSLGSVSSGTKVTLLAHDSAWGLIELSGKRGYIAISALNIQKDEFASPTTKTVTATVIASNVKIYDVALETASVSGSLSIATDVTVTAYTNKWARVNVDGKTGYVLISNLSTASYSEMKSGVGSSSDIIALQKALEDLGYFDGLPAGNYGPLTVSAVQRFQTALGVTSDGVASQSLQRVLYGGHAPASPIKSTSLSLNQTGSNVLRLQNRLTYKGYMSATIDGEYGPVTEKAVKLYQKTAGLSETGVADSKTLSSLFSLSAPKNPGSPITGGSSNTGGNNGGSTNIGDDPAPGTASEKAETVIDWALKQLGKPYIYGTTGPNSYDCSGLTYYCYKKVGVTTGRSAYSCGYNSGTKIEGISNLRRGDIVCFNTLSDNDLSDHVGIYLGNLKFVHASSSAGKVIISSLDSKSYYYRVFSWGRRVL